MAATQIDTRQIRDTAVTRAKLADGSVSLAKLANMATASFLGRNTAGTGVPEVLSVATVKTMLGVGAPRYQYNGAPTSVTPDVSAYDVIECLSLNAGLTINNPTGSPAHRQKFQMIIQDGGTARSLTWGSQFIRSSQPLPSTTIANKYLNLGFQWDNYYSKWRMIAADQEA